MNLIPPVRSWNYFHSLIDGSHNSYLSIWLLEPSLLWLTFDSIIFALFVEDYANIIEKVINVHYLRNSSKVRLIIFMFCPTKNMCKFITVYFDLKNGWKLHKKLITQRFVFKSVQLLQMIMFNSWSAYLRHSFLLHITGSVFCVWLFFYKNQSYKKAMAPTDRSITML